MAKSRVKKKKSSNKMMTYIAVAILIVIFAAAAISAVQTKSTLPANEIPQQSQESKDTNQPITLNPSTTEFTVSGG